MKFNIIAKLAWICLLFICPLQMFAQNKPLTQAKSVVSPRTQPDAYSSSSRINTIRYYEPQIPTANPTYVADPLRLPGEVKLVTKYSDGLGREIQAVERKSTPQGKDLVTITTFDEYGREVYKYMPYPSASGTGDFRLHPYPEQQSVLEQMYPGEQIFYSQGEYDNSPLKRVMDAYSPGNSWAKNGGNRFVENRLLANTYADDVIIWGINETTNIPVKVNTYNEAVLLKKMTKDEHGLRVLEFVDNAEKVILRRVEETLGAAEGHTGWLNTYFVYDDNKNLRFVISPKAVQALQQPGVAWDFSANAAIAAELCYAYRYDAQARMTEKKLPGADPVYIVYDALDNQVFVQDGKNRLNGKWIANFFDGLRRPVMTALYTPASPKTREELQADMNAAVASQTIEHTIPGPDNLVVGNRIPSVTSYKAKVSVELLPGFETATGEEVEVSIDQELTVSTETITTTNTIAIPASQLEPLLYSYYDRYPADAAAFVTGDINKLTNGGNDNADPEQGRTAHVEGLVTMTKARVIGTSQWLNSTFYYDWKGRKIQVISDNYAGAKDVQSKRYSFTDAVISTYLDHRNARSGTNPRTTVLEEIKLDAGGRITKITQQLNDDVATKRTLSETEYDELGRVKTQKLGQQKDINGQLLTTPLETLDMQYHVRGWLTGINKNYVNPPSGQSSSDNWFGMELNYDYGFTNNQYTGNLSGIMWRSKGDGEKRAYGLEYDNIKRLAKADFTQLSNGQWDVSAGVDYSVYGDQSVIIPGRTVSNAIHYDANGNLLKMTEKGLKLTSSQVVDDLTYTYHNSGTSNRLLAVGDNGGSNSLGDYNNQNITEDDFDYDKNGNLLSNKDKKITSITYNHLNLPDVITVDGKGTIKYVYDAKGVKLQKIVAETGKPSVVTDYEGEFIYENDVLRLISHREGRVRNVRQTNPNTGQLENKLVYDYFVRDHLMNIRMVLTEEKTLAAYAATHETALNAKENLLFSNLNPENKPVGYPTDNTTTPNDFVTRLNGSDPNKRIGTSLVLKVMAGDKLSMTGRYFYKSQGQDNTRNVTTSQVLSQLINAFGGGTAGNGTKLSVGDRNNSVFNSGSYPGNIDVLRDNDPDNNATDKPKAYLNFVMFDEQLKMIDGNSGVRQVNGGADVLNNFDPVSMTATKNGYLYVYLSNESPMNVFFDNLVVAHESGPLLEETHYYPFGLTMKGISSEALGKLENKLGFNGNELQSKEFSDGTGLDQYDFNLRTYDPQIGRFLSIDPVSEKAYDWTGYRFGFNNPLQLNDPSGGWEGTTYYAGTAEFDIIMNRLKNGIYDFDINYSLGDEDDPKKPKQAGFALPFYAIEALFTVMTAQMASNSSSSSEYGSYYGKYLNSDYLQALKNDFVHDTRGLRAAIASGGWVGYWYREWTKPAVALPASQPAKAPTPSLPISLPGYAGHGNDRNNTNPHIVYVIYALTPPLNGKNEIMKYGICDVYSTGADRPESQLRKIGFEQKALMDFKVLLRVPNRDIAMFVERTVTIAHWGAFGEFPPYNRELFTKKY